MSPSHLAAVRRLSEWERWERLFDPPCLGAPARKAANARALSASGGFVEIFARVVRGRVLETGFLTDIPELGVLLASLWCERAQGLACAEAQALGPGLLLERIGEFSLPAMETAQLCVEAGRAALAAAIGLAVRN